MNNKKIYFSEVIESSLQGWIAQTWKWDNIPEFGSIITTKSNDKTIFGIINQVNIGSIDPVRSPFPYQKTEEELLKEQPQIFEFLKTTFNCINVGYKEKHKIFHLISPTPPKIHSFVSKATKEEIIEFFQSEKYLHILFGLSNQIFNLDELLLAILKNLHGEKLLTSEKLNNFVKTFSLLTGNDYRRLKLFLQRMQNILD